MVQLGKIKVFIVNPCNFIYYFFFALAFDCLFIHTEYVGAILLLFIPVWGLVFLYEKRKELSFLHWYSIALSLLMLASLFLHGDIYVVWCFPLKLWCFILVVTTAREEDQAKIFHFAFMFTVWLTLFMHLLTVLSFLIDDTRIMEYLPDYFVVKVLDCTSSDTRLVGFLQNANSTAILSMVGFFSSVYCLYFKRMIIPSIFCIISSLFIFYFTNSRGSLLSVLVFVFVFSFFYFVFNFQRINDKQRKILIVLLVAFVITLFMFFLLFLSNENLQNFIFKQLRMPVPKQRNMQEIVKSFIQTYSYGSGRGRIIEDNSSRFFDSPVWGVPLLQLKSKFGNFAHNGFLLAFFNLGIPLALLYSGLFFLLLYPLFRNLTKINRSSPVDNFLLAYIIAIVISSFLENTYETILIYSYNYENSVFYLVYLMAYVWGRALADKKSGTGMKLMFHMQA